MVKTVRVPDTVADQADELQEEFDYQTKGEAIRHMCREGEWDV